VHEDENADEYRDYFRDQEMGEFDNEGEFEENEESRQNETTTKSTKYFGRAQELRERLSLFTGGDKFKYIGAIVICLLAHILFGFQPPFSRYLQKDAKIPTLSLIFTSNFLALMLYSPRWIYLLIVNIRAYISSRRNPNVSDELSLNNETESQLGGAEETEASQPLSFKEKIIYMIKHYGVYVVFGFALCLRTSTNILSTRFTKAMNVQMVASTTPFIVSFLSLGIVNRFVPENQREKWSWSSLLAMFVTVFGGLLIILGGAVEKKEKHEWYDFLLTYKIAWRSIRDEMTKSDVIGIIVTFISNCGLAVYMICLRFMKQAGLKMSEEGVYLYQEVILTTVFFIPALVVDDWSVWLTLSTYDWGVFVAFTICIYIAGNIFNIVSIQALGPSTTGSILALRLVSTIIFGGVLIGEWFKSIWQLVGSVIVMAAVTYFLVAQNKARNKAAAAAAASANNQSDVETSIPNDDGEDLEEEEPNTPYSK